MPPLRGLFHSHHRSVRIELRHQATAQATDRVVPSDAVPHAETDSDRPRRGISFRAVLIAVVLTWLSGYWVRQSEIMALACQGT